jgi:hypothetical protein
LLRDRFSRSEVADPGNSSIKIEKSEEADLGISSRMRRARRCRKPKAAPGQGVEGYLTPPPKPAQAAVSDLLDAMEAMKPLVASLGKEQVKRIDLLG